MGSLRNPIGPLPSSIYWRRRAVALSLVALLAVLIVWVVTSGGGSGDKRAGEDGRGEGAASATITPGPSSSESLISQRPGGRDEEGGDRGTGGGDDGADEGADEGGTGGDSRGSGGSGGSGDAGGSDDGAGGADGATGGGGGQGVRAVAGLPACKSGSAKLTLASVKNTYAPGEKPELRLTVENTGSGACKVDFGARVAVVTVSDTDGDTVWASDHCPDNGASVLRSVPADGKTTHAVKWNRKPSEANCATPSASSAKTGTYLAEVKVPGLGTAQKSFVLAKD